MAGSFRSKEKDKSRAEPWECAAPAQATARPWRVLSALLKGPPHHRQQGEHAGKMNYSRKALSGLTLLAERKLYGTSKELHPFQLHDLLKASYGLVQGGRRKDARRKSLGPRRNSLMIWHVSLHHSQWVFKSISQPYPEATPSPPADTAQGTPNWRFFTHQDWLHLTENQEGSQLDVFTVPVLQRNRSESCSREGKVMQRQTINIRP